MKTLQSGRANIDAPTTRSQMSLALTMYGSLRSTISSAVVLETHNTPVPRCFVSSLLRRSFVK